jgi:hypothetical protein
MMKSICHAYDVLKEASAARYQVLPKISKLRYRKELDFFFNYA